MMDEGWGLVKRINSEGLLEFIATDSNDKLYFVDPFTWNIKKVVHVTYMGRPFYKINDMTFIKNKLYANVYLENYIVRLDADSGVIEKYFNLLKCL